MKISSNEKHTKTNCVHMCSYFIVDVWLRKQNTKRKLCDGRNGNDLIKCMEAINLVNLHFNTSPQKYQIYDKFFFAGGSWLAAHSIETIKIISVT